MRIPAGSVTHEIASTIDMLPTFAALAGASAPSDRVIDGKDISDLLFAKAGAKSPHDVHYYEIDGVRVGKWKLVVLPNKRVELYDLDADLGERNNLAKQHPGRVAEMKALIDAHAEDLATNRRPAAFVKDPKPLLASVEGLPTLAEYMGLKDLKISEGERKK